MKNFLLPALLAVSVSGASYADVVYPAYDLGSVSFGCNGSQYTVTLQNYVPEVESCNLSCRSMFHAESFSTYVNPRSTTVVYGTFGSTPTNCVVSCSGPLYGLRPTVTVGGACGF